MTFIQKSLLSVCIFGTIFEWYDIAIFSTMVPCLSALFFPREGYFSSSIFVFLIFASGFFVRPIGAAIFGHLGDRKGRKPILALTIIIMSISTTIIGFLPVYSSVGYIAPCLLLLMRLIQGLAASGEHAGVLTYVCEVGPTNKIGFLSSLSFLGIMLGTLLATIVNLIVHHFMSAHSLLNWGWRIPFISSFFLGLIGYQIRSFSIESPVFQKIATGNQRIQYPIWALFKMHGQPLLFAIFILAITYVVFYIITIYIPSYLTKTSKISESFSLFITSMNLAAMSLLIFLTGCIADKVNHAVLMKFSAVGFIIVSFYLPYVLKNGNVVNIFITLSLLSVLNGIYLGPSAKILLRLFPPNIRYSAIAIGFNVAAALFGGTAPILMSFIERMEHNDMYLFFYISCLSCISIIIISKIMRETI